MERKKKVISISDDFIKSDDDDVIVIKDDTNCGKKNTVIEEESRITPPSLIINPNKLGFYEYWPPESWLPENKKTRMLCWVETEMKKMPFVKMRGIERIEAKLNFQHSWIEEYDKKIEKCMRILDLKRNGNGRAKLIEKNRAYFTMISDRNKVVSTSPVIEEFLEEEEDDSVGPATNCSIENLGIDQYGFDAERVVESERNFGESAMGYNNLEPRWCEDSSYTMSSMGIPIYENPPELRNQEIGQMKIVESTNDGGIYVELDKEEEFRIREKELFERELVLNEMEKRLEMFSDSCARRRSRSASRDCHRNPRSYSNHYDWNTKISDYGYPKSSDEKIRISERRLKRYNRDYLKRGDSTDSCDFGTVYGKKLDTSYKRNSKTREAAKYDENLTIFVDNLRKDNGSCARYMNRKSYVTETPMKIVVEMNMSENERSGRNSGFVGKRYKKYARNGENEWDHCRDWKIRRRRNK